MEILKTLYRNDSILILDEPTSGLDTPSAVALRRQLVELAREEGVTVFLTTHNLLEAEKVCDRVAVIRRGRLLVEGSPAEIHGSRSRRVLIRARGVDGALIDRLGTLTSVASATVERGAERGDVLTVDLAAGSLEEIEGDLQKSAIAQIVYTATDIEGINGVLIKIDGELMHTLMTDSSMQESVQRIVAAAQQRSIKTVAERVENANAMAVLFQLGLDYMQGHYVHEPEVVLQDKDDSVKRRTLEELAAANAG